MKQVALALLCLAGALQLAACDRLRTAVSPPSSSLIASTPPALPTPTLAAVATPTAFPSATPVNPDSGWLPLRQGLEQRILNIAGDEGEWVENITILRLDPAYFRFDVAYKPGAPQSLQQWQEDTGALLIVNGGFFTEENVATGLLISGGQTYGVSYEGFGGMFAISDNGPSLRWLPQRPYDPAEPLTAALQAFPMLLTPGGMPGPTSDDGQRARRTVLAQDGGGRILFLLAARGHFSLFQLSRFLQASDLDLDLALNLDGGASSGLLLAAHDLFIPPFTLLPSVIAVYER